MITEPNQLQHKDIQKHGLNVSKLEEATFEALGSFFGDAENPNNAKKKPYLREIFKVARYEERYKNGEIGTLTSQAASPLEVLTESLQTPSMNAWLWPMTRSPITISLTMMKTTFPRRMTTPNRILYQRMIRPRRPQITVCWWLPAVSRARLVTCRVVHSWETFRYEALNTTTSRR